MKCNQVGCDENAAYKFTWPGEDEAGICKSHGNNIIQVAKAMNLHLQLIPIKPEADSDNDVVNRLLKQADSMPQVNYLVPLLHDAASEVLSWQGKYMALELECNCGAAVEVEIVEDDGTVHFDTPEEEQG